MIRKENGNGVVFKIEKNRILVALIDDCGAKKECKGGCVSCASRDIVRKKSFVVPDPDFYEPGQTVSFTHHVLDPNLVSFTVFGIPVLLALVTMFVWFGLAPEMAESPPAVLSAGAAFFCGIFILKVIDLFFKKRYPASITGVSEPFMTSSEDGRR
ncbi:MAG: SoxR reducing system RseC family protein [Chitinispirillaceae bacterium]